MGSKKTDWENPTVERVRAAREALAKDCDYDAEKLGRMLMERQAESERPHVTPKEKPIDE